MYLAQILSFIAIIIWTISIVLKEKKDILLFQAIANFIYGLQYSLLGAFTASCMNFLSFIRLGLSYVFEKKKKTLPKEFLMIFVIIILIIGIITFDTLFTLIPVVITILYAYSLWQNNLLIARIVYIICAGVWIFYNLQVGAYVGIIGNILEIIAGGISIIKYNILKKQ